MTEKEYFERTDELKDDAFLRQEIRAAFQPVSPDEASKDRMLGNILAAAEEQAAEAAPAAELPTEPAPVTKPVTPIEFPGTSSSAKRKRSSIGTARRYTSLGIAACLVLIVGVGILVPNAMKSADSANFAATESVQEKETAEGALSAEPVDGATAGLSQDALSDQPGNAESADAGLAALISNRKYGKDAIQDGDPQVNGTTNTQVAGTSSAENYGWDSWIWFGETEFKTASNLSGTWYLVAETTDSKTGETLYELGFTLSDGTNPGWQAIASADGEYLFADFRYRST